MIELGLIVILILMIGAALAALNLRDMGSAVIALASAGLGLSACFLLLAAPDLALVQMIVEIIFFVVLVKAAARFDEYVPSFPSKLLAPLAIGALISVFAVFAVFAFLELPRFGFLSPDPYLIIPREVLLDAGGRAVNLVSEIILRFRALDTLGEITVLFAAIVGTLTVLREIGRTDGK